MAILSEVHDQKSLDEWIKSRPKVIQDMIEKFPADRLYRLKCTGHRCTIYSYSENKTLTVSITGEYNYILFPRHVFGIKLDGLEECDLPEENELLGSVAKSESEAMAIIKCQRFGDLNMQGKTVPHKDVPSMEEINIYCKLTSRFKAKQL